MASYRVKSYTMTAAAASASKPNAHADMLNSPSKKKFNGHVRNPKTSAIARDGSNSCEGFEDDEQEHTYMTSLLVDDAF